MGIGRDQVGRLSRRQISVECSSAARKSAGGFAKRAETIFRSGQRGHRKHGSSGSSKEISELAAEFDLWFHIDGAYGAPATLDERKRSLFTGLNRADSVSLDAHKWLYVPIDAGCLLFRDQAAARAAFAADEADYIKVLERPDSDEAFAFWDYGIELSRRFRALKIWLTFRYYGLNCIAAAISEDNSLAEYLGRCVHEADDFELLAPVELSICCFRYPAHRIEGQAAGGLGGGTRAPRRGTRPTEYPDHAGRATRRSGLSIQRDSSRQVCAASLHHKLPHDAGGHRQDAGCYSRCGAARNGLVPPRGGGGPSVATH